MAKPPRNTNNSEDEEADMDYPDDWKSRIGSDPKRSILFSLCIISSGAVLGPFLDAYHSAFGVLQYDDPIRAVLWGSDEYPGLTTAWWVPELFGVAGFLIGWLYILGDAIFWERTSKKARMPSPPKILLGISFFTLQYWLSGILFQSQIDRTTILNIMSLLSAVGFVSLDGTIAGFWTSAATGLGGPLIEVGLIVATTHGLLGPTGGYHYTDLGETGFFPLWIIPVYFLGGPANGNLARGYWNALSPATATTKETNDKKSKENPCSVCNDTRQVPCPNCDGVGAYVVMGGSSIKCTSCNGRGFVICRACFDQCDDVDNDVVSIREFLSRMPD